MGEPRSVSLIEVVGTLEEHFPTTENPLHRHFGLTPVVLPELKLVLPLFWRRVAAEHHPNADPRIAARSEIPEVRDPTPAIDRSPEATAHDDEVAQEAKRIEKVRLPGGVRPDKEDPALDIQIDVAEVAPVVEL